MPHTKPHKNAPHRRNGRGLASKGLNLAMQQESRPSFFDKWNSATNQPGWKGRLVLLLNLTLLVAIVPVGLLMLIGLQNWPVAGFVLFWGVLGTVMYWPQIRPVLKRIIGY